MPYRWTRTQDTVLTLWPHLSLPRKGFVAMIGMAFTAGTLPLLGLLGTYALWGILPFILSMVAALWWGLERSYKDGEITETLGLDDANLTLTHTPSRGQTLTWTCNIYWVRAELHVHNGPVPHYVTLSGNGRAVEIGRFLSEDERIALYSELIDFLKSAAP